MQAAAGSAEIPPIRPKRDKNLARKVRKKPGQSPEAPSPSWWDDRWHWLGLGLVGGACPFLGASLTLPGWTGSAGNWISQHLYGTFGVSASLLPGVVGSVGMHLLLPRSKRPLQLSWAPTLLWLDLVWISQRMGSQGGSWGAAWDGLVVSWVGPLGSWMAAGLGLSASLLAVCRIPLTQAVRQVSQTFVSGLERGVHWAGGVQLQLPRVPLPRLTLPVAPTASAAETDEVSLEVAPAPPPRLLSIETASDAPVLRSSDPEAEADDFEGSFDELEDEDEDELDLEEDDDFEDDPEEDDLEAETPELLTAGEVAGTSETPVEGVDASPPEAHDPLPVYEESDGQLRLFPGAQAAPVVVTYKLPPLSLLNELPLSSARPVVEDKSHSLLDALASFGVQASLLAIVQGPTVTRYELQPARGVKVSRFTSLTNDIALALAAKAVRIEAPIPGKAAIGIEIPNEQTEMVTLREILAAPKFRKSTGMSIALGKDLSGNPTFAGLQKMPHLLVAGTTGSGKSVCINALIMSLLYRFTPRELQLLMIDPKQVELSIYEGIPHLITLAKGAGDGKNEGAIICDPKRAALALAQVVELMEQRYSLFARARVRNLDEYNQTQNEALPWVVVIIDELADLMMVASKSVETSICRIAQKARAAGIHLVLATQRPSADVITGLIKVNVPSRIAFAVSSQVDSRVILDTGGAEQLLGKGDMLFCPVDASDPRRLQGCFVTNEEILRVVEWWRAQGSPENLIQLQVGEVAEEAAEEGEDGDDSALVEQALQVVVRRQQASASLLQTELKVGYARARRLIYLMEKKGYIGPAEGSKPRKILVSG